jgi:hypothetical protein
MKPGRKALACSSVVMSAQAQLLGQAVLQRAPQALDAALGLRRVRRDGFNAQFGHDALDLAHGALAGQLLLQRGLLG